MNGLHKVVVFHPRKSEELDEVLESELGNFQKRMLDSTMRPFLFRITEEARKFLLQEGTDQGYGGRHLQRAIERHVVNPIARLLATAQVHPGEVLFIDHYPGEKRLLFRRDTKKYSSGRRIDFPVANSGQLMTKVTNGNSRDET
jgi:ATP-dependent Clp protease ATP-binding subunit ClpA